MRKNVRGFENTADARRIKLGALGWVGFGREACYAPSSPSQPWTMPMPMVTLLQAVNLDADACASLRFFPISLR